MKAHVQVPKVLIAALWVVLVGGAAVVVFGVSAYLAMRAAVFGNEVVVPRLLGMALEPAREQLAALDLTLEPAGTRHDLLVPAGQILSQQPPPGTGLKPGRKVKVLLSLGAEKFQSPDLRGMPVPRARLILGQDGLRLGSVGYVYSEVESDNLVVAQDPPAGAPVEGEGRVDLLVSKGVRTVLQVMPDLVGSPLPRARQILTSQGYRLGNVRAQPDQKAPAGTVTRQFPLSGYPVSAGERISLVVSE